MVGVRDSIIGDDAESVIHRFVTGMPTRLPVASGDEVVLNSVLIEIDDTEKIFSNPTQKATEDYISGRFG